MISPSLTQEDILNLILQIYFISSLPKLDIQDLWAQMESFTQLRSTLNSLSSAVIKYS